MMFAVSLESARPVMRIQVCGPLMIERDGQRLEGRLPGRQGRLLFTYLVVNRHRQVARDELAEALWREPDPAAVDARLNPLVSKLRKVFGNDAVEGRSTVRLHLSAWVDLEAAAESIHRAESSVAQQDWIRAWGPALLALFVAERGFLTGEDASWIDEIRHQLTETRVRALECYAATELGIGGTELRGCPRWATAHTSGSPPREWIPIPHAGSRRPGQRGRSPTRVRPAVRLPPRPTRGFAQSRHQTTLRTAPRHHLIDGTGTSRERCDQVLCCIMRCMFSRMARSDTASSSWGLNMTNSVPATAAGTWPGGR